VNPILEEVWATQIAPVDLLGAHLVQHPDLSETLIERGLCARHFGRDASFFNYLFEAARADPSWRAQALAGVEAKNPATFGRYSSIKLPPKELQSEHATICLDVILRNLTLALELAVAGIQIFPASVVQSERSWKKIPLLKGWQRKATTDLAQIRRWWSEHPFAVPAIWCGHADLRLLVVDADRHDGGADGVQALADLIKQHDALVPHPTIQTAGGGFHHIFRQPRERELGNGKGGLPEGIDIRGTSGFIIAPGSVRPDGKAWKPVPGTPLLIDAFRANSIAEVPDWLVQLISPATSARGSIGREAPPDSAHKHTEAAIGGNDRAFSRRGRSYAEATLGKLANELRATKPGGRNTKLYKCAFRMGTIVARGWISSRVVSAALIGACNHNGLVR
jgi:hypothetical protein